MPDQCLLSNLLKHRVRCDQGLEHGLGIMPWMHPPVHRLLGWATAPSSFRLKRHVWRLDQLRGIGNEEAYVKGTPSLCDQITLDRLPTLLGADLLNKSGVRLGIVADIIFEPKNGNIYNYLISRSDPRIPGTSRWRLFIDKIDDQQPGMVSTKITSLDDLPLFRSSIKQDFLRRSRGLRDQLLEMTDIASDTLEGWLEDPPWDDEQEERISRPLSETNDDPLEYWDVENLNNSSENLLESKDENRYPRSSFQRREGKDDPWV